MPQKPFFVGIDVGGTNIKFGLVDDAGRTLAYHTMRTEQDKGAEDACGRMGHAVREVDSGGRRCRQRCRPRRPGHARPDGHPERHDPAARQSARLVGLSDSRSREPSPRACPSRLPTTPTRPPTANSGAAPASNSTASCCSRSARAIGGGIIVGDTLIEGEHSCGSECGHILVNPADDAPMDSLGKRGSLESYTNATAVD